MEHLIQVSFTSAKTTTTLHLFTFYLARSFIHPPSSSSNHHIYFKCSRSLISLLKFYIYLYCVESEAAVCRTRCVYTCIVFILLTRSSFINITTLSSSSSSTLIFFSNCDKQAQGSSDCYFHAIESRCCYSVYRDRERKREIMWKSSKHTRSADDEGAPTAATKTQT